MPIDKLPRHIQYLQYAEQYQLLNDPAGRAMRRVLRAGIADPVMYQWLEDRVAKHQIRQAFAGPFPLPKLSRGNLVIGL